MDMISLPTSKSHPSTTDEDGLTADSQQPRVELEQPRIHRLELNESNFPFLEQIVSNSRVLIIEGISGSGKDTFQKYLKKLLKGHIVYDYTEGEVLHSWKQFQIEGILELRLKFMKLFASYMGDIIQRDKNAVFVLNRFHLSTYAWAAVQHQHLGPDYDETIKALQTLPVHIFILHVNANEISQRSLHPERSTAWQKFQQQMVENYTFCDRQEKQQKYILEAARSQQISHSVIKIPPYEPKYNRLYRRALKISGPNTETKSLHTKTPRKRPFQTMREDN